MSLPKLTENQHEWVIEMLIAKIPHREIARKILVEFDDFDIPDGMDTREYEDRMIKRTKEMCRPDRGTTGKMIVEARKAGEGERRNRREEIEDRILELDGMLERDEIDEKKYQAFQTGAMNRLRVIDSEERKTPDKPKPKVSSRPSNIHTRKNQ